MEGPTLNDVLKEEKNEDCVEYFLFPGATVTDPEEELYKLNAAAQKIIGDYMWQSDPFGLRIPSVPLAKFDETCTEVDEEKVSQDSSVAYFHGITRFGDNVEDEWFVVYVLKEISKQFPGYVIRVVDNDGEFLLIEAADHLPKWAESDSSCRQRVYVYDGKIHLIPKGKGSSPLSEGTPSIPQAVEVVRSHPEFTLASEGLQKAIENRIGNYPDKMKSSWHYSNLMLPPKLVAVLKERPNLVAPGVIAFYFRDPVELKATRLMKKFSPGKGLVKTRLRFTRCLYAMLSKQDFRPDTRTGWNFPPPSSPEFKAHSLGAKLTTGFEILLTRSNSQFESDENGTNINDQSAGWLRYEEALTKTGYYHDYLEGSKPHQQLQARAKDFYTNNLSGSIQSSEDCLSRDLKNLLQTVHVDVDKLVEESKELPIDDNDSWMDIKPEDLESLLEAQFQSINLNPQEIPLKLKQFIEQMSDFSGIELSGGSKNSGTARNKTSNGAGDESNIGDFGEPVDFKADDFVSAMDKLLQELGATDKEWEASDDSYGSEEDDFDVNLEEIKKMHSFSKDSKIHELMQQMDDELATTDVGQTFTPEAAASSSAGASSSQNTASKVATANVEELDEFDEQEGLKPVNIDMNALANLLESFQSQDGPSGPSANLLRSVGFDMTRMKK